jgi:hypothetical protein
MLCYDEICVESNRSIFIMGRFAAWLFAVRQTGLNNELG